MKNMNFILIAFIGFIHYRADIHQSIQKEYVIDITHLKLEREFEIAFYTDDHVNSFAKFLAE